MLCLYLVSHIPALLTLEIPKYQGQNLKLVFYLIFITECGDILQFVFGKIFGQNKIAPNVSPNKTWEGFIGGLISSLIIAWFLHSITPFAPWISVIMSLIIFVAGFFGGLTMSAIKRDYGVKDYGSILPGHGGILDRIDSLCFAAPLFFHLTRYFYSLI